MLKLINTKLLIAIFVALLAIGGLLVRQNAIQKQQAEAAIKAAAILAQQQYEAEMQKKAAQEQAERVNAIRRSHNMMPGNEGKAWNHYLP